MKYENKDSLYLYFKSIIDQEVEKLAAQLQEDVDKLKHEAQVTIEQELKEEQDIKIDATKQELEREYHFKIAHLQREKDLEIMRQRRELLDQLFSRLEGELTRFRESAEYSVWIDKKVKHHGLNNCKLIQVDPHDDTIKAKLNNQNIEEVEGLIGGFVAYSKDGKNVIDETFKNRISEAQKWFYDNAKWFSDREEK